MRDSASTLDLKTLVRGTDSFELRIWNRGIIIPDNLVVVNYAGHSWHANETEIYESPDAWPDSTRSVKLSFVIPPELFYDSLMQFTLRDIPNQADIPGFKDGLRDGESFHIEIAGRHYYHLFSYHCPEYYSEDTNSRKFMQLLHFIGRNLKGSHFWFCGYPGKY